MTKTPPESPLKLRQRTEEKFRLDEAVAPLPLSYGETELLLHDLRVHQIELEMQNEELRRSQKDLEASRSTYFELYDLAPIGYLTINVNGLICDANLTAAIMLGLTKNDLQKSPITQFIFHEDQNVYYLQRKMFINAESLSWEMRLVHANGSFLWVNLRALLLDDDECRIAFVDITERKLAEVSLQESEARHRLLAETMLHGLVYQDANGTIISMNPAAERILGWCHEEFLGSSSVKVEQQNLRENGEPFPGMEHPAMVALRTGLPVSAVVMGVYNQKLNEYRWISIGAVPLFRPGESSPYEVFTLFEDITERKQAEDELAHYSKELEEANTALHVFLDRRERTQKLLEEKLQLNVEELVVPYLKKLSNSKLDSKQSDYLTVLETNLNSIVSPYLHNLSTAYKNLTPQEIQIANLIRQGKNTKEIAILINTSEHTVGTHRNNIRKKLQLRNSKSNLRSHLLSLQ